MATPNILEHYLVSLSMKGPSSAEQREAEKAFSTLAEAVAAVVPAIAAAGTGIVYATDKIASGLGKLYFESQKTGATVREITALGYAFEQNGSTLEKFHADFDKFSQTLRDFPAYRTMLKDRLGLKPEDFKDDITTYSATLKALAEKRAAGDTQTEGAFRNIFGFDEDNIVARGRKEFDKYYDEGLERNKGIDEISVKALALVRSLNAFGAAIEAVGRKASAALFDKYGIVLGDMTKWVDDHSNEIVATVTEVVGQLVLAYKDIEPIAVPAVHLIAAGLDRTAAALDRLLGSPDGQHGGLHAVRYVLDALAAYIAGKWALRLLGLLSLGRLIVPFLRTLGPPGVAAAAAYEFFGHVPKAEGDTVSDQVYGLDHPGWHPGMPKEKTRAQKDAAAPVPPADGDSTVKHPPYYHGTMQIGDQTFHYGTGSPDRGRGSSAFGDHPITGWDPAAHHGVGGGAFRIEDQNDPNVPGGPREQVEIHEGRSEDLDHLYTAGCFAVPPSEWPRAKAAIMDQLRSGNKVLRIGKDGNASIVPAGTPMPNISTPPKPQSMLQLPHDIKAQLASLTTRRHPVVKNNQWMSDLGSNKNVQIHVTSTDPHMAASEIARHVREIHAENYKNLHRPYGHGSSIDRVRGRPTGAGWLNRGIEHNDIRPPSGSSNDEVQSGRYEKYGRRGI